MVVLGVHLASGAGVNLINHGVVFEHFGDLSVCSRTHTLGLVFRTTNVSRQVGILSQMIQAAGLVANEQKGALTPYFVQEVTKITHSVNETAADLSEFLQSFSDTPTHRVKRSTNLLGYLAGSVLGLATDDELEDLVQLVNADRKGTHVVLNQETSYMEVTDRQMGRLTRATMQIENAYLGLVNHIRKTDAHMASLDRHMVLGQVLTFLGFSAMEIQNEVAKIVSAIENMVQTFRLSPVFLSPSEFLKALVNLQDSADLLFPPTKKFLSSYYDVSRVIVKKIGDDFIFMVRIPLMSDKLPFDLYKVNSFWHRSVNRSEWARKADIDDEFLAVRKDSKYFSSLKNLDACVGSRSLTVCAPKHGYQSRDSASCLMALFLNIKSVDNVCIFKYKEDFAPSFTKVGGSWIASSGDDIVATEVCPSTSSKVTIKEGISEIKIKDNCEVVGDSFKLPAFINRQQHQKEIQIITPIKFPDMPSPTEIHDSLADLHLEHLDTFSQAEIHVLHQHSINLHKVFYFSGVLIALVVVALLLITSCVIKHAKRLASLCNCCGIGHLRSVPKSEGRDRSQAQEGADVPLQVFAPIEGRRVPLCERRGRIVDPVRVPNAHRISEIEYEVMVSYIFFIYICCMVVCV